MVSVMKQRALSVEDRRLLDLAFKAAFDKTAEALFGDEIDDDIAADGIATGREMLAAGVDESGLEEAVSASKARE